ncbi:uncharacterized protein LOC106665202 isoform X2 [Cimex lectularius]|uniref:Odorant binding protein n=1 Tax=Cimex lectularius TaxID=79782 RepID=A0A8I6RNL2_CIMLE|nr:uncharacterized protein LOC106665202 isoform X2 [Cimex lectularius]
MVPAVCIFFLACFSTVRASPPQNIVLTVVRAVSKCKTEFSLNESDFKEMLLKMKIPDTEQFKCMMACLLKEMGQYHDGQFDLDAFEKFNRLKWRKRDQLEKAREVNVVCTQEALQDKDNECEMAFNLIQCLLRESQRVGLPVTFTGQTSLL